MQKNTRQRSEISRQLYQNVKFLARANGLRMKEVEQSIGLSSGYFSRCSQSRNSPHIDTVCALSKLFSVPIEDLISDSYEKRIQAKKAKTALSDAVMLANETLSKEEILRIARENAK